MAEDLDLDVWVIRVELDPMTGEFVGEPEFREMSRTAAFGLVDGFLLGGSPITPINGGLRITLPNGYWDVVLKESLEHGFRYTGPKGGQGE